MGGWTSGLPPLQVEAGFVPEHPANVEVPRLQEAVLHQGRYDLRGLAHRPGQVALRNVPDRQLQEWG